MYLPRIKIILLTLLLPQGEGFPRNQLIESFQTYKKVYFRPDLEGLNCFGEEKTPE
jgi:hypothetical protein